MITHHPYRYLICQAKTKGCLSTHITTGLLTTTTTATHITTGLLTTTTAEMPLSLYMETEIFIIILRVCSVILYLYY